MENFLKKPYFLHFINKKMAPWVVCWTASLFYFFQNTQANALNSFNLPLTKAFHLSAMDLGYILSGYFYANILFLIAAGVIVHHVSKRLALIAACFINIIAVLLFAGAQVKWHIFIANFLIGLAGCFSLITCLQLARHWFPPTQLATITGLINTMGGLGGMAAQTPFTVGISYLGWRGVLLVDALVGVCILLLIFCLVEDAPHEPKSPSAAFHFSQLIKIIKETCRNPQNWLLGIYIALMNLPAFVLGALWGNRYFIEVHHLPAVKAGYIISTMYVGGIISSVLLGYLSDLFSAHKKTLQICALLSLVACSSFFFTFLTSPWYFYFVLFLLGTFSGSVGIGYALVTMNNDKDSVSTAQGLVATIFMAGGINQLLFSWLLQLHHHSSDYTASDYHRALLVFPVGYLIAFTITFFINEKR